MKRMLKVPLIGLLIILCLGLTTNIFSQDAKPPKLQEKEVTPIRCWFKSDRSLVRIGEIFLLTLTCQVLETESDKAVPLESALEPSAISLSPYEVVAGLHQPDIHHGVFRFIQYQYKLRLMGEDFFGKEVPIPELEVKYKIERRLGQNQAFDSRDKSYLLPAIGMKISSVVPKDAKDIRDSGKDNFQTVKSKTQNAYIAFTVASVVAALPILFLTLPFIRAVRSRRNKNFNGTVFSNIALLRRMNRELNKVRKMVASGGWDAELVGKVLTVVRIMGAIAMGRQINQLPTRFESRGLEGQLKLKKGFIWPKKVLISSNLTPETAVANKNLFNSKWADEYIFIFEALNNLHYNPKFIAGDSSELLQRVRVVLKKIIFSNLLVTRKCLSVYRVFQEWRPVWRHS